MILIIYGDDTFRVQERVQEMREAFAKKHDPTGMNLSSFPTDGQTLVAPGEALQAACSFPFLAPKRMVVVREVMANLKKDTEKIWLEGIKRIPASTILIFWETDAPASIEKSNLFKSLQTIADVHTYPFPFLEDAALTKWVNERVSTCQASITPDAVRLLVECVGSDLWQMNNEIGKLTAFAAGEKITIEMVKELVRATFEGQIFTLVDALARRNPTEALRLLEEERAAGSDDHYLLTMVLRQVRLLIGARSSLDENPRLSPAEAASALGVPPFLAGKVLGQARDFTFAELKHAHDELYHFDVGMKSGKLGADLAVDLTALNLLKM